MTRSPGCAHRKQCRHGTAFGRIYCDERMIRCTRVYCAPRCVCNFGGKRNDLKARGFHEATVKSNTQVAHRRNSGREFCSRFPVGSAATATITETETPQRRALLLQTCCTSGNVLPIDNRDVYRCQCPAQPHRFERRFAAR